MNNISVSQAPQPDLNGYDEWNYLITAGDGKRYIFKIATDEQGAELLNAQVRITEHLAATPVGWGLQQHIPTPDQQHLVPVVIEGKRYYLRLLNFLEGEFWVSQQTKTCKNYIQISAVFSV